MGHIYTSVEELIGHTPLIELTSIEKADNLHARVLAKLERTNPGGSAKDRIALEMVLEAERSGAIAPHSGCTIIEPTSGNTGVGLAMIAAARGYRAVIVMPETMSEERRRLIAAFGAELVLTPGAKGMGGAIEKANEIAAATPGSIIAGQFSNPANPSAHYKTTGPELWDDTNGDIDVFVAGVGTGGTITGVGRYLKERKADVRVVAVEPASSPVLSRGMAGAHKIQGIGAGFVPEALDRSVYDEIMTVTDDEAFACARRLSREAGLMVGISSGAAAHAAIELARRPEFVGKTIATLLVDTGERYLSTELFA